MFKAFLLACHYAFGVPCGLAVRLLFPILHPLALRWGFIGPKSVQGKVPSIPRWAMVAGGSLGGNLVWVAIRAEFAPFVFRESGYQLTPADYIAARVDEFDPDWRPFLMRLELARRAHPGCALFVGTGGVGETHDVLGCGGDAGRPHRLPDLHGPQLPKPRR